MVDARKLLIPTHFQTHAHPKQVLAKLARGRHVLGTKKFQIPGLGERTRSVRDVEIRPGLAVPVLPDEFLVAEILLLHLAIVAAKEAFVLAGTFDLDPRPRHHVDKRLYAFVRERTVHSEVHRRIFIRDGLKYLSDR